MFNSIDKDNISTEVLTYRIKNINQLEKNCEDFVIKEIKRNSLI